MSIEYCYDMILILLYPFFEIIIQYLSRRWTEGPVSIWMLKRPTTVYFDEPAEAEWCKGATGNVRNNICLQWRWSAALQIPQKKHHMRTRGFPSLLSHRSLSYSIIAYQAIESPLQMPLVSAGGDTSVAV